ncbi:MAG: PQQ-dependent sugar dehydrogenase [Halioglobus sp.]|nr:PQQ-dependent sugar dehydrogenase [Halioglobus sp.]
MSGPRSIRVAPNGDIFVAETWRGQITVLRANDGAGEPAETEVFADDLEQPFGIAFYPSRGTPEWVYVATLNSVLRFPYESGDLVARGAAEVIVDKLADTTAGHSTRDIVFSRDDKSMFVSVGSQSNIAETMGTKTASEIRSWEANRIPGAAWGNETNRADVLVFTPDGRNEAIFASGIRNCLSMALQPRSDAFWCVTNERDLLGDDLVPDYATVVKKGAFYGWPWYYLGNHEDPRLQGQRPDLAGQVTVPDVLFQAHSAALGIAFYDVSSGPAAFPAEYRGDAFVTFHGSWNRGVRTGYKVVRMIMKDGVATGAYEDFLTGFVIDNDSAWGRPTGVAVAHDGALLVSDDGSNTLWRVAYDQ